jgi:hypothetical protein
VRPKVYVAVTMRSSQPTEWGPGDVAGVLLLESGEPLWSHYSSSLGFLRGDLTTTFADRRLELERRFPDGYDVVILDLDDEPPAELLAGYERHRRSEGA